MRGKKIPGLRHRYRLTLILSEPYPCYKYGCNPELIRRNFYMGTGLGRARSFSAPITRSISDYRALIWSNQQPQKEIAFRSMKIISPIKRPINLHHLVRNGEKETFLIRDFFTRVRRVFIEPILLLAIFRLLPHWLSILSNSTHVWKMVKSF
jgi:hypothetical protein